jgi:hypothetical protein
MSVKDYIFQIFGEDYVSRLDNNRIEKVALWGDDFIHLENGKMYCLYTNRIHREFVNSIPNLEIIDIESNFWKAKSWKRECLLNTLIY